MLVETIATSSCRTILELQSELDAILLDALILPPGGKTSAILAVFVHRRLIIEPDAQLSRFSGCDLNGSALYHAG